LPKDIPLPLSADRLAQRNVLVPYDLLDFLSWPIPRGASRSVLGPVVRDPVAHRLVPYANRGRNIFGAENPRLPIALVYQDSFFEPVMPFFSEHFRTTMYVNIGEYATMNRDEIMDANPDVVVEEIVERKIGHTMDPPVLDAWMGED
jgi:hypothetical protein